LKKYVHTPDNFILDTGCGTGVMLPHLKLFGKVTGIDSSITALNFSKKGGSYFLLCASIENMPFKENIFGIITALDVIEHIENDIKALKEINKILGEKGIILITVPAFKFLWSRHDEINQHKRRYTRKKLREKVEASGFNVLRITYANLFLFPFIAFVRFLEKFKRVKFKSDFDRKISSVLNKILIQIFSFEKYFLRKFDFSIGVSLICVARKK